MLVAPLNWGLGHATRCIPIIESLLKEGFEPIIASDGNALLLLQKEFPFLRSYTLPDYKIKYSKSSKLLKLKLLLGLPSLLLSIKKEKQLIDKIVETEKLKGIISDNRFGVYSNKIPSVYITHQLTVLSGITTKITSKIHLNVIKKFDECWIPDFKNKPNFSGDLGHLKKSKIKLKYLGILSRFNSIKESKKYDLMVLLSGPEPQRAFLEQRLLTELKPFKGEVLFVRGVLNENDKITVSSNFHLKNYLLKDDLEKNLNQSEFIISRSGYTSIMDFAVLGKKVLFIPTPSQNEQEYLAHYLSKSNIAPFVKQDEFKLESLELLKDYKGFSKTKNSIDLNLFSLFKGE